MRKLTAGEIYNKVYSGDLELQNAITQQLSQNIGVIAPEQIETALLDLKTRSKNSYYAFLSDAIALYETRGLLRLFNLSNAGAGRSKVPTSMPYFPAYARNRVKENEIGSTGKDMVLFVNMYRIGNWSADGTMYNGLNALTDLYSCLESGVIGYKINIQNMGNNVFESKDVLEYLIKIYTFLFSAAMQNTKTTYGGSDFQNDSASFLIARFFLLYVLQKNDSDMIDDYAYLAVQNRSSIESLKSFEEISMIDYSSLSSFLTTFGQAFYNGEPVLLANFENKWISLYGDSTGLSIEFAPYLIHFLFAAMHGATLGGSLRLTKRVDSLKKIGLIKLYNAVVNALK